MIQDLGNKFSIFFSIPSVINNSFSIKDTFDISKTTERWLEFKSIILYDESLKTLLSDEHSALYTLIFDIESIDPGIKTGDILKKLINFVKLSSVYKPPLNVLISVFRFLSAIISKYKPEKVEKKENPIKMIQNEF